MADEAFKCVHGREHSWYRWRQIPTPFDLVPAHGFLYVRTCAIMGCDAVERAEDLGPVGRIERYHDSNEVPG